MSIFPITVSTRSIPFFIVHSLLPILIPYSWSSMPRCQYLVLLESENGRRLVVDLSLVGAWNFIREDPLSHDKVTIKSALDVPSPKCYFACCLCIMNLSCMLQDNFQTTDTRKGTSEPEFSGYLHIRPGARVEGHGSKADLIHKIFGLDESFYVGPTPPPSHGFGGTTRLVPTSGLLATKLSRQKMFRVRGKSLVFSIIRDQISKVRHQRCQDRDLRCFHGASAGGGRGRSWKLHHPGFMFVITALGNTKPVMFSSHHHESRVMAC